MARMERVDEDIAGDVGDLGGRTFVPFACVWTLGFAFTLLLRVLSYRKYCT